MASINEETCQDYATIAPLPESKTAPFPQPYSVPITSHTPHSSHTAPPIRPRLGVLCSRPTLIQLRDVTRPIQYKEEAGEGDYSDAESEDRKCTPQEWIPKWKVASLKEDSFMASGKHDLATTTTLAMTEGLQISGDFGNLKTHKTDNPLSTITLSYTATSEGKPLNTTQGKSLTTQDSASSVSTKKSIDEDEYCQWAEWNLPVPAGLDSSRVSSDNEYTNEGLGPPTSKIQTQTSSQSTSDQSVDTGPVTEMNKVTIQKDLKSGSSDNDEYYVNEGLGPITKQQDKKARSERDIKDNKIPSLVIKQENEKITTEANTDDSCDDDGYFVMESLQQNQLQTSVQNRPPHKETWVPGQSYKFNTLQRKRFSEPNPSPQFGRSYSIENFASKSTRAYTRREASFSHSSYDGSKHTRPSLVQRHHPRAFNMGFYPRQTVSNGATMPVITPEKHEYEYIQVPKKKGASYLQSVSEWMESQRARREESVTTKTTEPVDGTLV